MGIKLDGRKIMCINAVRKVTGLGLKDAKNFVDEVQKRCGYDKDLPYIGVQDWDFECLALADMFFNLLERVPVRESNEDKMEIADLRYDLQERDEKIRMLTNEVEGLRKGMDAARASFDRACDEGDRQEAMKRAALTTIRELVLWSERTL